MEVFRNQDWVWSLGLMLSGLFFAIAALRYGVERLRREVVNGPGVDLPVGRWWVWVVGVLVPLEALVLLAWWLGQAAQGDLAQVLAPWSTFNVGTVLVQWGIAIAVLLLANRWLAARSLATDVGEAPEPAPIGQSGVAP
jgi:NSS family neurotransmitter:Na+ symporter